MALLLTKNALEKAIDAFDAETRRQNDGDAPPPLTPAERKRLGASIRAAVMTMLGEIKI